MAWTVQRRYSFATRRRALNLNRNPCVTEEDECLSMRLTMKSVISRMSTGSGGVRQMVRLLSLKPSLKLRNGVLSDYLFLWRK